MKKALRTDILNKRKEISKKSLEEKSKKVEANLFDLVDFNEKKNIMFFVSFGNEVHTHEMIKKCLGKKTVIVPKVFGDCLLPCKINSLKELSPTYFDILEPVSEEIFPLDEIDVVIVPGLAFTPKGERIGYGKGYYDRFLSKCDAVKIGLSFEEFIVDKIPTDKYDINVDFIISDERIIDVKK